AFPLHRGAGHYFRPLCRHLLLVPEGDWPNDERFLGQGAFLAFTHLYERDFPADVLQGMLGMHRRWYDGGQGWNVSGEHIWGLTGFQWNTPISIAALVMGLAQIP